METISEAQTIDVCVETDLHHYFAAGECIIEKGENSDHAYQLVAGTAKVIKNGDAVATIHAGEYFGSIAALTRSKRNATVIASSQCVVVRIERKRFAAMIRMNPEMIDQLK